MNIRNVVTALAETISSNEGHLARLKEMAATSPERIDPISEVLESNNESLKQIHANLVKVIAELIPRTKSEPESWAGVVDRQSGAFTDDELNDTGWH